MAKEPGYFTFIKNDGTSTSTSITAKYDTMTAPSISNISGVDWTRSNYNFVEWNTDSNGTGASCSPGDTIDWDTYGVCYAIWEEKHEVTIYYKGSTIAGMDASGTKTLNTEGTWVEADISVEYDRPTAPTPVYQSKTVNPSTSSQTVSADTGYDALSDVTVNAMPSGTAGTPTATKGTVSNHSIAVTPSVTNTTGYITGGTKTGTAVSVSASELVSGTYNVSSIGTTDITNYKYISVPSGEATATAEKGTVSNHSISITPSATISEGYMEDEIATGTAVTVTASELVSGTLSVSSSGTQDVTNYASVSVPSGSAKVPNKSYSPSISISVDDETGEIQAYGSGSYTLAPTVTAGYVSSGTSGTISVSVWDSYQLPIYEGEHHQPPIFTVSLTNPVNSSYFDSCEIYDTTNGETKIGEITSATGSVSLDLTDRFALWDVDTLYLWITLEYKSGGFIHVDTSKISCTGDVSYDGYSYGIQLTVTGAGTVVIDGVDYNYGA